MAVFTAPVHVEQRSCSTCMRPRTLGVEMVACEQTVVDGAVRVQLRPRVTVLEGCGTCEGSTVVL